ncbi:MAG: heat shock protein Hsp20 [Pseudonocardiales bacterium]|jgi:HSP20 family protein|nr:heat shock protein Hsp20 [Pseudonocardiales bacterium]
MALMRFDPFRELDRLSEQVMGGRVPRTMPMEAWRRKDEFYVHIDLPGIDKDDVDLTVERNVVSIRAERRPAREEGDEVIVDERPHGIFTRQLFLGDNLDANKLSADYDRGVLMLTIPVAEESKPRRVQLGAQQQQELQDSGSESAADQNANEQPVSADSA